MVNRIPNCYLLTNKLGLLTSLHRYEKVSRKLGHVQSKRLNVSDFLPETYRIDTAPEQREFLEAFKGEL